MEEVRCPMCSKPNPIEAEVCEFCSARIKPLIIQQEPEGEPQRPQEEPREPSEQPADQPRAETDWLSRMRTGTEVDETVGQDLEDDSSVPKRGETDLLGRFRDLGISDDDQKAFHDESPASEPESDEPEDLTDFEDPLDIRASLLDPGQDVDIEERISDPDQDIDIGERLSAPDQELDIAKRLSIPDQEIDIGERLSIPDPDDDEGERLSLPDQDIDFDQILSTPDLDIGSGISLPETEDELDSGTLPLEDVLSAIISEEPLGSSDQDGEVVPDWLARIRARKEVEETSEPTKTGDTDWLTGLREVSLTDDKVEKDDLTSEEDIFPFESSEATKDATGPLQREDAFGDDLQKEVDSEAPLTSVEDLISELDTLSEIESEDIISDESPLEEPLKFEQSATSIEDLISELDELSLDDNEIEVDQASSLDFDTTSAETEDDLQLEDLFADIGQPSTEPEGDPFDSRLFNELDSTEEKTEDQIIADDLFADMLTAPSKDVEAGPIGDILAESSITEEEEDTLLSEDFFADLGLEVPTGLEAPLEDELAKDFLEKSDEAHPLESEILADEIPIEGVVQPTDDSFLADLIDGSSELKDFDFAPGSDQLAKDPDFDDLSEISADLPEGLPFDDDPREPSPLSDILGDFSPSWMDETVSSEEGQLPHVPALILDDELPPIEGMAAESDTVSVEIPSWLQDLGKDVEEELESQDEDLPVLTKATLPPWLEAMRPLETFRAPPEFELEEEEEIVEAAGPLAGLRGVLLAEPVVAMPRTSVVSVGTLDISDRDYSQTEILQQMVEEEESEEEGIIAKRISLPLIRWISAALLVLGVTVPSLLGFPSFNSPTRAPRELSPFLEIVRNLPADMPVLIVFDYEPSHSAEMDAVAGALIENLMAQGQPMITLSTQPSGPLLADRMLRRVGNVHDAKNGEDYLHLGYLSGGPTAIQLFAASPTESIVRGFKLPEEYEGQDAWDSPLLEPIQRFSDFSMVAVISSGTESARNWAEQVQPLMGNSPLVMVLSAGVEPIIRPYYETDTKQIDGILSGLPSAMIYESVNGLQADATQRWNGYGSSVLIAVMILLTGTGFGAVNWLLKRFGSRES